MKCKKCKESMDVEEMEFSTDMFGAVVIFKCEDCNLKVQCYYNFEDYTPDPVFWSDEH